MRVYEGLEADSRYSNMSLQFTHEWYIKHRNLTTLLNTHSNIIEQKQVKKKKRNKSLKAVSQKLPSFTAFRIPLEDSTTVPILQMGKQRWGRFESYTTSCSYHQDLVQTHQSETRAHLLNHVTILYLSYGTDHTFQALNFSPLLDCKFHKNRDHVLLSFSHFKFEHLSISWDSYCERSKIKW